jgi:hypothetical protein
MLRVDPEPFESPFGRLTVQREIEGRLFLPRASPPSAVELLWRTGERGLSAVEGSRNPGIPRMLIDALPGREQIAYLCRSKRLKGMA